MKVFSRRQLLGAMGAAASGIAAGCGGPSVAAPEDSEASPHRWTYVPLDPAVVAEAAYRIYPEGGCMYAVTGSILLTLAEQVGEPYRSFPIEMMRYGDGGVGGWGTLCGVINGGAALIGLFYSEKDKQQREELITELCTWYETASLPRYRPAQPAWAPDAPPSVAGSVLCHVSVSRWCTASGCEAFSVEKKERCRRLATDGAVKLVELLNDKRRGRCPAASLGPEVKACLECHGPKELADAMGKMRCAACHQFPGKHP